MDAAPRMKATRKTYLECSFHEKDACKAEGGWWDGEKRKWYVPVGAELGPFARWLPSHASRNAPKRRADPSGSPPAAKRRLGFDQAGHLPGARGGAACTQPPTSPGLRRRSHERNLQDTRVAAAAVEARRCSVHDCDMEGPLTVNKEGGNKGRKFYVCPQKGGECNSSGGFQWADEPAYRAAPADWTCDKHGCHLSIGPFSSKRGEVHNVGRRFYLCPQKMAADDCSLRGGFRWADGSRPFSAASCRVAERHHGLPAGGVSVGVVGVDGRALPGAGDVW